jgi:hypothetical protein
MCGHLLYQNAFPSIALLVSQYNLYALQWEGWRDQMPMSPLHRWVPAILQCLCLTALLLYRTESASCCFLRYLYIHVQCFVYPWCFGVSVLSIRHLSGWLAPTTSIRTKFRLASRRPPSPTSKHIRLHKSFPLISNPANKWICSCHG